MKKILIIILLALPICLFSQTVNITMEKDGGVFKVPCEVNGAKMKFIFDTGATMVSLSLSMANYLYDNNFIDEYDFEDLQEFMDANGTVTEHLIINIRDLSISGLHIKNVKASVNPNQEASLLLGLSAIQRLGKVSINGNILTIALGDVVNELSPTSFLGVNFGIKKVKAREILKRKYTSNVEFDESENCDYIEDVEIGGILFTAVFFYDQTDTFVAARLWKSYKKNEQKLAFKERDAIAKLYAEKYPDIKKELDEFNNYQYFCGGFYYKNYDEFGSIVIYIESEDDKSAFYLYIDYYNDRINDLELDKI